LSPKPFGPIRFVPIHFVPIRFVLVPLVQQVFVHPGDVLKVGVLLLLAALRQERDAVLGADGDLTVGDYMTNSLYFICFKRPLVHCDRLKLF
jgi:hypothetical protein